MATQALFTPNRALDANAYALPGATATFYASGTMTLIPVYSDSAGTIATTNPVVADGDGVFPQTYYDGAAKVIVRDSGGATLWTLDPVPGTSADSTGASNVSFSPTVDVPETNVQAAIEAVAASVITGATDFGLGITGNAPTIGNIDATAQASGVYRFTAASTGTFPSGVTAATTGLVRLDRQTAAEAIMYMRAAGQSRYYVRHLVASAWGAWQGQVDPATLVTASETIASNDNDTTIPTSAAVFDLAQATGRILLSSQTASGSATLDFTAFNNATYRYYEFELENVKPATDGTTLIMRFSTNAGVSYDAGASDYTHQGLGQGGGGVAAVEGASATSGINLSIFNNLGNAAGEFGVTGRLTLYHAGDAASSTRVHGEISYENSSTVMVVWKVAGRRLTAQDTDAVRFLMSSGNIASGVIRMYGVN